MICVKRYILSKKKGLFSRAVFLNVHNLRLSLHFLDIIWLRYLSILCFVFRWVRKQIAGLPVDQLDHKEPTKKKPNASCLSKLKWVMSSQGPNCPSQCKNDINSQQRIVQNWHCVVQILLSRFKPIGSYIFSKIWSKSCWYLFIIWGS